MKYLISFEDLHEDFSKYLTSEDLEIDIDDTTEFDEEMEKLKQLGIEFSEEFQGELLQAYDDYSNFIR